MSTILSNSFLQFQSHRKMAVNGLPQLLNRVATLLNEGYLLVDCMTMLLPYHVKDFPLWQQKLQQEFEKGSSVVDIFALFGVKKQYLLAISLADLNGQLAHILQKVSEQMIADELMKKRLYKLLAYPILLFLFLFSLFIGFRIYFLPNILAMFASRTNGEKTSGLQWSKFFLHMPDYIMAIVVIIAVFLIGCVIYIRQRRVDLQLQVLMRLPGFKYFWRILLTRQFSRALSSLLLTGFSLQQALQYLKNQSFQSQLSYVAKQIEQRIIYGDSLAAAIAMYSFFSPSFEQFVSHGEKSGLLARELMLYSDLLDEKLATFFRTTLAVIQPMLFIIIAVCIVAAYLSILLPMYNLLDFI